MPVSETDYYDTATLLSAVVTLPSAPTFLKSTLFATDETTPSDTIYIDTFRGNNKLAPYVAKRKRGVKLLREPITSDSYSPPRLAPVKDLRADDLMRRIPGEAAFTNKSGIEREAYWLAQDFADLDNRISRRIEQQISQVLFTGKIVASDADDKKTISEIDYGAPESIPVTTKWDQAGSDPHADLRNAMRHLSSVAYVSPDLIVLGRSAAAAYVKNAAVVDAYSKFWVRPGELKPEEKSLGVFQLSTWMGLSILSYEAVYTDDDGTEKPFVPDDAALVASTAIKHKIGYGGVSQVEPGSRRMNIYEGTRVPQVFYSEEDDCRYFRLTSRPVPVPADMLGWVILDVI
jgi:Phage major capsid protein E